MKIFKQIKDAVYSPSFYSQAKDTTLGTALSYFTKVVLLSTLVISIFYTITFSIVLISALSPEVTPKVVNLFPKELNLVMKDGKISTNVEEPYYIPFPKSENNDMKEESPKNLVIIDTKSPLNLDLVNSNETLVLITEEYLVVKEKNAKITIQPTKSFPNIEINQTKIYSWIDSVRSVYAFIIPIAFVLIFVSLYIASSIGYILAVLILTVIALIITKIQKKNLTYSQLFKLGIYASTSLLLVSTVLSFGFISLPVYISILIFLISLFVNLREIKG